MLRVFVFFLFTSFHWNAYGILCSDVFQGKSVELNDAVTGALKTLSFNKQALMNESGVEVITSNRVQLPREGTVEFIVEVDSGVSAPPYFLINK